MSFTSEIKDELVRIQNENKCCDLAQLCGFVCFAGSISYTGGGAVLKLSTESESAAKRCIALMKKFFSDGQELLLAKSRAGRGGEIYNLVIDSPKTVHEALEKLGLYDRDFEKHISFRVNNDIIKSACCKRAFVRGAFLGSGSAANPEKSYHLEFSTHHKALVGGIGGIFEYFSLVPKTVRRKSSYVTYFKNGEDISDVLNIIGAHKNMMEFMNVRIIKDKRNNINRRINCESANMDKTLGAAFEQIRAIEKIKSAGMFENLPPALIQIANIRLENPDASLKSISELLTPSVSRSGVSHRLTKIMEIAKSIDS